MIQIIKNVIAPISARLKMVVTKFIIDEVDDTSGVQQVKVVGLQDEVIENIERFQEYGFSSVPLKDCEALGVFVGGNRGNGIIVATDDRRYRPVQLKNGDVAIYTANELLIYLDNDAKKITINGLDDFQLDVKNVIINTENATINASAKAVIKSGSVEIGDGALEKVLKGETFQAFFNSHTHVGNLGAPTSPPSQPSTPSHLSTTTKGS